MELGNLGGTETYSSLSKLGAVRQSYICLQNVLVGATPAIAG
jgi:hypothetical protein